MMGAAEIASSIGPAWPAVLERLGIGAQFSRNKHGPCPSCGGKDRYRFDNRGGRGGFFCNGCGPGSGYDLLMRVHGWDFRTALARVAEAAGLSDTRTVAPMMRLVHASIEAPEVARPPARVTRLLRECCAVADCAEVVDYLRSRHLWPLPEDCTLRAHPCAWYFDNGQRAARYPALLAPVRDIDGALVTVHLTYVPGGRKLATAEPRKLLSPLTGRIGSAVRLSPLLGDVLGVCEGVETGLAAMQVGTPWICWAALNTSGLAKFEPPATVKRLVIFADRDVPGLTAAGALMQRLQGRVELEIRTPPAPHKDWCDVLVTKREPASEVSA